MQADGTSAAGQGADGALPSAASRDRIEPEGGQDRGRRALRVRSLSIERYLGLTRPDQAIRLGPDELSPHLTLITGPNGSGKTTTARALQRVLWPQQGEPGSIEAQLSLGEDDWTVEILGSSHRCSQQGQPITPPMTCPAEERDRYTLSLHELLTADDQALADHIFRELSGGYSLADAREALSFTDSPTTPRGDLNALREINRRISDASREQRDLRRREASLGRLREQVSEASSAAREFEVVESLLAWREAGRAFSEARGRLKTFDPRIDAVRPGDLGSVRDLRKRVRDGKSHARQLESSLQQAKEALAEATAGTPLPEEETLEMCRGYSRDLKQTTAECRDAARALDGARERELDARRRIGDTLTDDQLENLDRLHPDAVLEEVVRKATDVASAQRLVDRFAGIAFEKEESETGVSEGSLRRAMDLLHEWLAAEPVDVPDGSLPKRPRWLFWVAAVGVVVALILAVLAHWAVGIVAVPLAVLAWQLRPADEPEAEPSRRPALQKQFGRLELAQPQAWQPEDVLRQLQTLDDQWRDLRVACRLAERDEMIAKTLREEAAEVRKGLDELKSRVTCTLGVDLDERPLAAFHLVERVSAWQDAREQKIEAEKQWGTACEQLEATRAKLQTALQDVTDASIDDASQADGVISGLARKREQCQRLQERVQAVHSELQAQRNEVVNVEERIAAVLQNAEIHEEQLDDAEKVLQQFTEQREAFIQARQDVGRCQAAVETARKHAKRFDSDALVSLQTMRSAGLKERADDLRERAGRRDGLLDQIRGIETEVRKTREGHRLEELLAERDRINGTLAGKRELGWEAIAGQRVCAAVSSQLEKQASGVLRRARTIMADITRGRYRVVVDDVSGQAQIRALDTTSETLHSLNTLSSGTRVQLLIAARLAFLESIEGQGPMLPLVLDEVLGNSDDERAAAVIDAVIAALRQGRQVITLTAQTDEVAKWRMHMEKAEVSYRVVTLPRGGDVAAPAASTFEPSAREVPAPSAGEDRLDYARRLQVPAIDPVMSSAQSLHLWYLIEDLNCLHALLQAGYERWGQLRMLLDHGGGEQALKGLLAEGAALSCERVRALADAYREVLTRLAVGRGKPVDRMALEESGAVTERFIDEVADLAAGTGGSAEALIQGLRDGQVKGFQAKKTDELEEWLTSRGYRDPRDTVGMAELRPALHAVLAEQLQARALSVDDVDAVLQTVAPFVEEGHSA